MQKRKKVQLPCIGKKGRTISLLLLCFFFTYFRLGCDFCRFIIYTDNKIVGLHIGHSTLNGQILCSLRFRCKLYQNFIRFFCGAVENIGLKFSHSCFIIETSKSLEKMLETKSKTTQNSPIWYGTAGMLLIHACWALLCWMFFALSTSNNNHFSGIVVVFAYTSKL